MSNFSESPNPAAGDDNPFGAPHASSQTPAPATAGGGDSTGGVIPYKNPHALIAYYLGIFSLFPCLGLALAIPAFVLGIMGLRARNRNPAIKGSVHAWIGIVMGAIFTVVWGLMAVGAVIAFLSESMR